MIGYSEVRVDAEIAEWPGVEVVRREKTAKHQRIVLRFAGQERFVIYPLTPSDTRGELNHIQSVRQTMREMGATRNERRKAKVRRNRNRPKRDTLAHIQSAPVKTNPFEVLQSINFKEPREQQMASPVVPANASTRGKILVALRRVFVYVIPRIGLRPRSS